MSSLSMRIIALFMCIQCLFSQLKNKTTEELKINADEIIATADFCGRANDFIVLSADSPVEVDCAIISEAGSSIKEFKLEALVDNSYQLVTMGDTVNKLRFCSFDKIASTSFKLTVLDCKEEGFSLSSIKLCKKAAVNKDSFKVVSYLAAENLTEAELNLNLDPEAVRVSTDIILIGVVSFDENGIITVKDDTTLRFLISEIRRISPETVIHINILGPKGEDSERLHRRAMNSNRSTFIKEIKRLLTEYECDGIYFDWEYPYQKYSKFTFSSFLISLDRELPDKQIGAALSGWCCSLNPKAIEALDCITVMAYDLFDDFGYHSSFTTAHTAVEQFLSAGYPADKLTLGLAFYSRPIDEGLYWHSYKDYYEQMGKYKNTATVNIDGKETICYFNSAQLIEDKTTFAVQSGLGGVMIWHFNCDTPFENPLSLYRAIDSALS